MMRHPAARQPSALAALLLVSLGACGPQPLPEELANAWTFYGEALEVDECQLEIPTLLDGKYVSSARANGGIRFDWDIAKASNPTPPGPIYCERAGTTLECQPFAIPHVSTLTHQGPYRWGLTGRLRGLLSPDGTRMEVLLDVYGTCPDGGTDCTAYDPEPNPPLPCRSRLALTARLPIPIEPGPCPEKGVGSSPTEERSDVYITNLTGDYVNVGWLNTVGQREGSFELSKGEGPYYFGSYMGTWFFIGDDMDRDNFECLGAWYLTEPEVYVIVR